MHTGTPVPLYEGPDWAACHRRILLISWEFPPRGTAGALRWEKFSAFLHEAGYGLDVIMAPHEVLTADESARLGSLPPSVRVFGLPIRTRWLEEMETSLAGLGHRLLPRGTPGTVPDGESGSPRPRVAEPRPASLPPERISWIPKEPRDLLRAFWATVAYQRDMGWGEDAASLALRIVAKGTVAVVTCGPPHGAHVAGRRLGVALGIPHILDYRDPWSLPRRVSEAHASPLAFALARSREKWILQRASLVVTNTDTVRSAMEKVHPGVRGRTVTIYNGYDDEPIPDCERESFRILYAGGIYLDRDPRTLFRGAALAIADTAATPEEFRVELMGNVGSHDGVPIKDVASGQGLVDHLRVRSSIPRAQLLHELAAASVLVSLPQDSPWAIPSKIFEYMPFSASLLVYAHPGTPTWDLLQGSGVDLLEPEDVQGTREALTRDFLAFREGQARRTAVGDDRFSRARQAARLIAELERCIGA
jgi:hypothetical protein